MVCTARLRWIGGGRTRSFGGAAACPIPSIRHGSSAVHAVTTCSLSSVFTPNETINADYQSRFGGYRGCDCFVRHLGCRSRTGFRASRRSAAAPGAAPGACCRRLPRWSRGTSPPSTCTRSTNDSNARYITHPLPGRGFPTNPGMNMVYHRQVRRLGAMHQRTHPCRRRSAHN